MSIEIKNLSNRPVLMRLNSGHSIHLAPGAHASAVPDAEISNNAKVKKLQERHIIALNVLQTKGKKTETSKKVQAKKPKK